jgi:hypothetical protein
MALRSYAAGLLAIVGALLMLGSGYSSRGLLFQAFGISEHYILDFGGAAANLIVLGITIVELIIALGGLTVLIGGLIILAHHTTTGRVLIYLGGGTGFLGLLISLGYSIYKLGGINPILAFLPYWVGLALAISGRRLAKGA